MSSPSRFNASFTGTETVGNFNEFESRESGKTLFVFVDTFFEPLILKLSGTYYDYLHKTYPSEGISFLAILTS